MIKGIDRKLYHAIKGDRNKRKAIAFAILMKNLKPSSVVKDWSYKLLARITDLSPATCKKYTLILREMKLVRFYAKNGHNYLYFNKLKARKKKNRGKNGYHTPKHKDADLGNYDGTSVKMIEMKLKALAIVEIQRQKDYVRQSISAKQNPKDLREFKKAQKICRARGWDSYNDNGISYKYICRQLNCSPNTVSATIQYGEETGMFTVTRSEPELVFYGRGEARQAARYLDDPYSWYTENTVFYQPANKYVLTISE